MDNIRNGNFTSSEIFNLMSDGKTPGEPGKPYFTYIKQTNWERKLGRSLDKEVGTRSMTWGKLVEYYAFNQLGTEYQHCSQDTLQHPDFTFWVGSPDGIKHDTAKTVVDFKCPELATFCELSECETIEEVRDNHKDGDKFYWQLVSNAIITGAKFAELIIFLPYLKQLQEIREMINDETIVPPEKAYQFFWIQNANDEELVYLPDEGCLYPSIHIIRWAVSDIDKELLKQRVISASLYLTKKNNIWKK